MRFQSVKDTDAGVRVTLEDGTTFDADLLLVAVGRGPVSANLGYDEVGVAMDRGFVMADESARPTSRRSTPSATSCPACSSRTSASPRASSSPSRSPA